MKSQESIIRYSVPGARRLSNYIWGLFLSFGGLGFLGFFLDSQVCTGWRRTLWRGLGCALGLTDTQYAEHAKGRQDAHDVGARKQGGGEDRHGRRV